MESYSTERLFWVDLHFACIGIMAVGGIVTHVAPIAGWMKGKTLEDIRGYLVKKRAVVIEVKGRENNL